MEFGYFNISAPTSHVFVPTLVIMNWKDNSGKDTDRIETKTGFLGANLDVEANRCPNCQIIAFSYVNKEGEFKEKTKPEDYSYGDVEKYLR